MGYHHFPTEMWWHDKAWKVCSSNLEEDPECSNKLPWYKHIGADHILLADILTMGGWVDSFTQQNIAKLCALGPANEPGFLGTFFAVSENGDVEYEEEMNEELVHEQPQAIMDTASLALIGIAAGVVVILSIGLVVFMLKKKESHDQSGFNF